MTWWQSIAQTVATPEDVEPEMLHLLGMEVLDDWFPGSAVMRDAQHWKGARPMLPAGPPLLGETGAPGVWMNLGHGSSGWPCPVARHACWPSAWPAATQAWT